MTGRRHQSGFTLLELIVVMGILAIIAAVALTGYTRVRMSANESAAVYTLRTIQSAQDAFRATCGHGRDYATSLAQLGAAEVLSRDLSTGPVVAKSRYQFTVTATEPGELRDACATGETATHWYASAQPQAGGMRGFATADGGDIWQDTTGAPPKPPFTPSKTVSRLDTW